MAFTTGFNGKVKVTQVGSPIGRTKDQRATLIALGLNKLRRSRVIELSDANRGRIEKISHLVQLEQVDG